MSRINSFLSVVACILLQACNEGEKRKTATLVDLPDQEHRVDILDQENKLVPSLNIVGHASGDLNQDGLADSVMVVQDTIADTRPYRLKIFFSTSAKAYQEILSLDSAIDAERPEGKDGYATGNAFNEVTITAGVLHLSIQLLRGSYEHLFRYQNNQFELIGFNITISDGNGSIHSKDYNLSTGRLIITEESYETDKLISRLDTIVRTRPLPNLQHFRPYTYHEGKVDF